LTKDITHNFLEAAYSSAVNTNKVVIKFLQGSTFAQMTLGEQTIYRHVANFL